MSVKPGTVTLTRSLNASRPNSIRGASRFFDLNEGSDTYNVVVLPMSEYKKIEDFNTPWLEVQDFLS